MMSAPTTDGAYSLNGSSQYLTSADTGLPAGNSHYTIEAWVTHTPNVTLRLVLAAFLLIVAGLARTAGAVCPTPDASFDAFFARFQQDSIFRLDRVEWP